MCLRYMTRRNDQCKNYRNEIWMLRDTFLWDKLHFTLVNSKENLIGNYLNPISVKSKEKGLESVAVENVWNLSDLSCYSFSNQSRLKFENWQKMSGQNWLYKMSTKFKINVLTGIDWTSWDKKQAGKMDFSKTRLSKSRKNRS